MALTTLSLADYSVLLNWIRMTQSRLLYFYSDINHWHFLTLTRTKQQLQSGEIAVSGDQWTHFLVHQWDLWSRQSLEWPPLKSPAYQCEYAWCIPILHDHLTYILLQGIQACVYITEYGGKRAQGYACWQCPHSWYDCCHYSFCHIYCNAGHWNTFNYCIFVADDWDRFNLQFVYHQCFLAWIQQLIQRCFTTLFLTFWKIQIKEGK